MSTDHFQSLQTRVAAGDADAKREIETAVVARRGEKGLHTEWGLLCEQAGLISLAFTEFQLALRDDRDDPTGTLHLAQHYRERGDAERALKLLERLLDREPARAQWLEPYLELLADEGALPRVRDAIARAEPHGLPKATAEAWRRRWLPARAPAARRDGAEAGQARPAETAAVELAEPRFAPGEADAIRMHTLFAGREDVHARQWSKPGGETGYTPIHEPLTPSVIKQHFNGQFTLGVYPVRLDGTVTFFALDLDIDKAALQRARGDTVFAQTLRDTLAVEGPRLAAVLGELGFAPLFENSGYKGRHFWVFLAEPAAAEVVHLLGRMLVAWQSPQLPRGLHIEFFPKQGSLKGKGLGNLIKLPLGIHRRTGKRSLFLDAKSRPLADQFAALRGVERLARTALYAAVERLKTLAPGGAAAADAASSGATPPWEGQSELAETAPKPVAAPAPPARAAVWTEADFESDPRVRHLLAECPVLGELKRTVDEHRRLTHEEQLVLIHSLGHVAGGPQAVNYLLTKCVDVGPEKLMKDRLKGNPVSCPSIRKKIPQVTRRVPCNCPFEFASDRYPTPVLHLLTLRGDPLPPRPEPSADLVALAQRFGVLERRRAEIDREWSELRSALVAAIAALPGRELACPGGRYRVEEHDGVEQLSWVADPEVRGEE
ncbi:MAG TPA: CRISPR-associated primase-polymerase type A1 [Pirellulales bacterium]|nr:CRISPR-associated primase-polymerase type A1 [Pirellulales bacterium]